MGIEYCYHKDENQVRNKWKILLTIFEYENERYSCEHEVSKRRKYPR